VVFDVIFGLALILGGSLFVLLGAALAGNRRNSARRMADWANQLDDRWYFLPGKAVSLGRARFYGFTMFCVGAGWVAGGVVQLLR
jgi:hypothetical protein